MRTQQEWWEHEIGGYFGATLFPDLSVVESLPNVQGFKWDKWLELRPQIIDIEDSLAEEWFSPELMAVLRLANLINKATTAQRSVISAVQA